jgi:hypothetical protein
MGSLNPALEKLGFPPDARLVIFHADDVGMGWGSVQAFADLTAAGILKTGSIMPPCPWFLATAQLCQDRPDLDVGLHLTLTSEWSSYRWGPMSTRQRGSGLLDETGYFWPRTHQLAAAMNETAAIVEMKAQAEAMGSASIRFTHIDTHMGAALLSPLLPSYVEMGFEYGVPVLLPRCVDDYLLSLKMVTLDPPAWAQLVAEVEERGMPLIDWFRITPGHHPAGREADRAELYEAILRALPPGITYFSLHPNAPGDIDVIIPERAYWRTFEHEYFRSERLAEFLHAEGIVSIGYRELRDLMRNE